MAVRMFASAASAAGFTAASIEPTRIYGVENARAFLDGSGLDADAIARDVEGRVMERNRLPRLVLATAAWLTYRRTSNAPLAGL